MKTGHLLCSVIPCSITLIVIDGVWDSLSLDPRVRTNLWIHDEVPDDSDPGRVARKILIELRCYLPHLKRERRKDHQDTYIRRTVNYDFLDKIN